jgi:hypothetical protein
MEDFVLIMEIENGMSFIPILNDDNDYHEEDPEYLEILSDFQE